MPGLRLHLAVAVRSFRRWSTYRAATLSGIFTNSVFGVINAFVLLAVWRANPGAGGYDATDAVTYVWLGQSMIMTIMLWGGGAPSDLAERIRTGDVALDLYRPVGLLSWYLAADAGRAVFHLLTRGVAPTVVGALLFDLRYPDGPLTVLAFALSVALALLVSFAVRMLVAVAGFWVLDSQGLTMTANLLAIFFSGITLPLVLFPGWLGEVAMVLPWASYLQVPADVWLGQRTGGALVGGLALQVGWAVLLLGATALVLRAAERKVVVQGG
ncbi:ABC transporter permease [Nocardioides bruguierae]|uniref:ABC-2 family transporter protein n=1 Tax=Nocardioides bruguierae TaxID=2945102 RepID=A0A9X2D471_9ACTN|nr:ABC-2 family transporter protein [Nocardioides bruguierae]MCM0618945.1 ABC-2 family transporter protein [Nocardioides bruguierae]